MTGGYEPPKLNPVKIYYEIPCPKKNEEKKEKEDREYEAIYEEARRLCLATRMANAGAKTALALILKENKIVQKLERRSDEEKADSKYAKKKPDSHKFLYESVMKSVNWKDFEYGRKLYIFSPFMIGDRVFFPSIVSEEGEHFYKPIRPVVGISVQSIERFAQHTQDALERLASKEVRSEGMGLW